MTAPLKTRFCPSPTGYMHLGNARTALFNALLAYSASEGVFLLRIEDTDPERSKDEYTEGLKQDLRWMECEWHEGPEHDQGNGPYHQSERQAVYDKYYAVLEQKNLVYPCFCTEQELKVSRKLQRSAGKPPRYTGTCRSLNKDEVQAKKDQGLKPTLRFRVEDGQLITFEDLVRGKQRFNGVDIGDFIIRRGDGTAPFMYCNAIDDALMGVTHALRGEDHLTNTPRQLLILQALELPVPQYGHISLIVGSDGSPLSKRHGSKSIRDLREQGFLPEAIINYMARLGHYYESDEFMSFAELANGFGVEQLGRAPAKYDEAQLMRRQHQAVAALDLTQLEAWLKDELMPITTLRPNVSSKSSFDLTKFDDELAIRGVIPNDLRKLFLETVQPNITFPSDVRLWKDIFFDEGTQPEEAEQEILDEAGNEFFRSASEAIEKTGIDFKSFADYMKSNFDIKGKKLFQPVRIALTGQLHGPEMVNIFKLLGENEIIRRFNQAIPVEPKKEELFPLG